MSLNIKEIEQLAKLAKLQLTDEEKARFSQEISSILLYIDKLQELKINNSQLSVKKSNNKHLSASRDDRTIGTSLNEQNNLIALSPESKDNLIKTKAVFEN